MDSLKWCDLPKELWPMIGKFVHGPIDVLRFRSVCSLWRSSCPPFERHPPPPRLPLHFFFAFGAQNHASLLQSTIYRMESLIDDHQWLVKFEEHPESGKMRLLDPVTNSLLKHSPESTPKNLNLLEFRVVELRKSYGPSFRCGKSNATINSVHRWVVMPRNHLDFGVAYAIFMIRKDGKLEFARCGDDKLTNVDEQSSHCNDIIVYKGQCYVVDKWGIISWVNSALEVIQFSPPLCGFGGQKHLVESCGDLYVVDQYFEEVSNHHLNQDAEAIDFKVYKLDQEWGKWVDVKDLGDQVFILSNDGSFSVSTRVCWSEGKLHSLQYSWVPNKVLQSCVQFRGWWD